MYRKRALVLLLLIVGVWCDNASEESSADSSAGSSSAQDEETTSGEKEVDTSMNKALDDLITIFEGYEDVKDDIIQKITEQLESGTVNITIIGWQNIHDDAGNLKQINTLELSLPSRDSVIDDSEVEFSEDYDGLLDEIQSAREALEESTLSDADVQETLYRELYSSEGSTEYYQIMINKDETYASLGAAMSSYNKTIRGSSPEEISAFYKEHEGSHTWPVSTLSYDAEGNFLPELSKIVPSLLVTVKSIQDDAPVAFVEDVVKVVGHVAPRYPIGDISEELYLALTKKLTEYTWNVIESPDSYYVNRDYALLVTYDPEELEYRSEYYIYANKIQTTSEK